jgi:hypothetical protein
MRIKRLENPYWVQSQLFDSYDMNFTPYPVKRPFTWVRHLGVFLLFFFLYQTIVSVLGPRLPGSSA